MVPPAAALSPLQSDERKVDEAPRALVPPVIKAVVCSVRHRSSLVLGGRLGLDGQDLEWVAGKRPRSLHLPLALVVVVAHAWKVCHIM